MVFVCSGVGGSRKAGAVGGLMGWSQTVPEVRAAGLRLQRRRKKIEGKEAVRPQQ